MNHPARHIADVPPERYLQHPQASAHPTRRLDRRPGVSRALRIGLLWAGAGAGAVLLWFTVGRLIVHTFGG